MRLLIASGLIAGITPTSMRRGSRQGILAGVFSAPDGADAVGNRPEEFSAYIRAEKDKWAKVVKSAGIKLE